MPDKRFALEPGGTERLELGWKGAFKNLSVSLDGQLLGSVEKSADLKRGRTFALSDGSRLKVELASVALLFPELRIERDGEPLPGSGGDPAVRLAAAANVIFFVAILNAALGLVAWLGQLQFLQQIGLGLASVVTGIVYAVLGVFVKRRSMAALAVTVALFVLDGIFGIVLTAKASQTPNVGPVIFRIFLLMIMGRGFAAIRELNAAPRPRPRRQAPPPPLRTPASASIGSGPAPVKVLDGAAEAHRRALKEVKQAAPTPPSYSIGARVQAKPVSGWGSDAVAKSLRFVAHKCEVAEAGLSVTFTSLEKRDVAWGEIVELVARQLPADAPWDGKILLDVVHAPKQGAKGNVVRVLTTTFVNYPALPGGASTSRLENLHRLAAFIRSKNPGVAFDAGTAPLIEAVKVPQRLSDAAAIALHEQRYPEPNR